MPQDPNPTETPNPSTEAEPTTPPRENPTPSKATSLKRRRINLEWKSQYGSADGYSVSKRVVLSPAAETARTPVPTLPSAPDSGAVEPLPPEVAPAEQVTKGLEEGELRVHPLEPSTEFITGESPVAEAPSVVAEEPAEMGAPSIEPIEEPLHIEPTGIELPPEPVEQEEELGIPAFHPTEEPMPEAPITAEAPSAVVDKVEELEAPPLEPTVESPSFAPTTAETPIGTIEEPEAGRVLEAEAAPRTPSVEVTSVRVCPFLGLRRDRSTHYTVASVDHVCYSPIAPGDIAIDYQSRFCFSSDYPSCQRFSADGAAKMAAASTVPVVAPAPLPAATAPVRLDENEPRRRSRVIDVLLWGVAILLAIVAIWSALPILTRSSTPPATAPIALIASSTPTVTPTVPATQAATPTGESTLAPLVIPTPSDTQVVLDLLPDSRLTGWVSSGESEPHWGDAGVNVGTLKGATYVGIIQFNLNNLPPGSKIQFAALELTGSDASHLGQDGEWHLEVMNPRSDREWLQASSSDISSASALASFDQTFKRADLALGNVNRFMFDDSQMQLMDSQFQYGSVTFRLTGPASAEDNLFAWDSGAKSPLNAPALHLVVEPGTYTIVTNTPTPANVLTAAANLVRQTANATRFGTPTPLPPGVATATPGGETIFVPADTAVPENVGTAIARSALATAMALTTGTYTPTPIGIVVVYPTSTPYFINANQLATPTAINTTDYVKLRASTPYHALLGSIVALSNFYTGVDKVEPIVLNTGGGVLGKLSSDLYYKAALDRDQFSPDFTREVAYPIDDRGVQQVGYFDTASGAVTALTRFAKGKAYDAAWSADGGAIVFVSQENLGCDDLYYYDLGSKTTTRLTQLAALGCPFVKHPSWSPDGQNVVFWSSSGGASHIWVIGRNGQNMMDLSNTRGDATETDPVWVK